MKAFRTCWLSKNPRLPLTFGSRRAVGRGSRADGGSGGEGSEEEPPAAAPTPHSCRQRPKGVCRPLLLCSEPGLDLCCVPKAGPAEVPSFLMPPTDASD